MNLPWIMHLCPDKVNNLAVFHGSNIHVFPNSVSRCIQSATCCRTVITLWIKLFFNIPNCLQYFLSNYISVFIIHRSVWRFPSDLLSFGEICFGLDDCYKVEIVYRFKLNIIRLFLYCAVVTNVFSKYNVQV